MYIKRATIENIRSIEKIEWDLGDRTGAGWHVILGDNGSGKSSLLRAIALALVGPLEAHALREDWDTWLRHGAREASILLKLEGKQCVDLLLSHDEIRRVRESVHIDPAEFPFVDVRDRPDSDQNVGIRIQDTPSGSIPVPLHLNSAVQPSLYVGGEGYGWFSAAYGPFRRFEGEDRESRKIFDSNPRLGAHLSVFGENIALSESLEWLRELNYKSLERDGDAAATLASLQLFINQDGFLPHNVKLKGVSSKGVEFEDANGLPVPVEELSDGYRSILSMAFELIRQLVRVFGAEKIFDEQRLRVIASGVVLIDEVDAHLHPTWQKQIGFWLTEHFPNIQFIVTTHSPLVCHAAVKGSIFRLPTPGDPESRAYMVKGLELDRLLYGDILAAYSTEAFGTPETKSPESREMRKRLAALNTKEVMKGLNPAEKTEQQKLRAILPTEPQFAAKE